MVLVAHTQVDGLVQVGRAQGGKVALGLGHVSGAKEANGLNLLALAVDDTLAARHAQRLSEGALEQLVLLEAHTLVHEAVQEIAETASILLADLVYLDGIGRTLHLRQLVLDDLLVHVAHLSLDETPPRLVHVESELDGVALHILCVKFEHHLDVGAGLSVITLLLQLMLVLKNNYSALLLLLDGRMLANKWFAHSLASKKLSW